MLVKDYIKIQYSGLKRYKRYYKYWYLAPFRKVGLGEERLVKMKEPEEFSGTYEEINNGEYQALDVKGKVVIDIGANVGVASIYFAKKGAKKIISYEAVPIFSKIAEENIRKEGLQNKIIIHNQLILETEKEVAVPNKKEMFSTKMNTFNGKKVNGTTLDKVVKTYKLNNAVIKMDIEGFEYKIFSKVSKETLKHFGQIILEFHDYGYLILKNKLENCGFKTRVISIRKANPYYSGILYAWRMN